MAERIIIRDEASADAEIIHDLTAQAFAGLAHSANTEQFIVDALRKAEALTISQVALIDGEIVGHVAISPVTITDNSSAWFGLGPISVSPALQKQGIGSALMNHSLDTLQKLGAKGCVLLGNPLYYFRFGFKAHAELVYPDVPAEYFQALLFGDNPLPKGIVSYHPAFAAKE